MNQKQAKKLRRIARRSTEGMPHDGYIGIKQGEGKRTRAEVPRRTTKGTYKWLKKIAAKPGTKLT